jgi:hypothetical protein
MPGPAFGTQFAKATCIQHPAIGQFESFSSRFRHRISAPNGIPLPAGCLILHPLQACAASTDYLCVSSIPGVGNISPLEQASRRQEPEINHLLTIRPLHQSN